MKLTNTKRRRRYRAEMFEQQEGKCHWCGGQMTIEIGMELKRSFATFEHIIPVAQGGSYWSRSNIVLAHRRCNELRGRETDRKTKPQRESNGLSIRDRIHLEVTGHLPEDF